MLIQLECCPFGMKKVGGRIQIDHESVILESKDMLFQLI